MGIGLITTRLLSTCLDQGRLSITASMRIESYEEETGKKAGQIFDDTGNTDHKSGSQTPKGPKGPKGPPGHMSTYHPFQSATDFAAAQ